MSRTMEALVAKRKRNVAIMRTVSIIAGIYQLIWGERSIGLAILASVAAISAPGLLTRGKVKSLPLEFEMILFFMVVLQLVIGETLNFYDNVRYFDKFVHFTIPFFLGFISFILAYTMQATGNLRMSRWPLMFVIVMFSLGLGAVWEIIEYFSDNFLGTYLQASLTASPLVDTMNDLIADLLGGIFGALLGWRYMTRSAGDKNSRFSVVTDELAGDYKKITTK